MSVMYGSQDTIPYTQQGFDNSKYLKIQRQAIVDRIDRFADGRLYLEIGGGKILHDPHAARVLPGFKTDNKKTIIRKLAHISEIIYCSVKSFGLNSENGLFFDFCPMAFDKKGAYWLTDSKEIMNPYFGKKMLKCGEIKEIF